MSKKTESEPAVDVAPPAPSPNPSPKQAAAPPAPVPVEQPVAEIAAPPAPAGGPPPEPVATSDAPPDPAPPPLPVAAAAPAGGMAEEPRFPNGNPLYPEIVKEEGPKVVQMPPQPADPGQVGQAIAPLAAPPLVVDEVAAKAAAEAKNRIVEQVKALGEEANRLESEYRDMDVALKHIVSALETLRTLIRLTVERSQHVMQLCHMRDAVIKDMNDTEKQHIAINRQMMEATKRIADTSEVSV